MTTASVAANRRAAVASTLFILANVLNYYDRLLMTVVAEPVKKYFGLSDTQLGLLTGPAFVFIYISATLIFGWLADRHDRRLILASVLAFWSAVTAASGFARNFLELLMGRAGVGIGEGASNPAVLSMLGDLYPVSRRGRAIAKFQSGGMIGILLTFLVGGWVTTNFGWRAAFLVAGAPGVLLAVAVLIFVRDPGHQSAARAVRMSLRTVLIRLGANGPYRWIVIATSLSVIGNLGMLQWLPLFFIRSHGLGLKQIGLFFGPTVAGGMMTGMLVGGAVGDRLAAVSRSRPLVLCLGATLVLAPLYWMVLWVPSTILALGLTFFAIATSVCFAPSVTAVLLSTVQHEMRGMAIAIFNFFNGIIGQAFFPLVIGILSDSLSRSRGANSLRWSLTIVISVAFLAAGCFIRAMRLTSRVPD